VLAIRFYLGFKWLNPAGKRSSALPDVTGSPAGLDLLSSSLRPRLLLSPRLVPVSRDHAGKRQLCLFAVVPVGEVLVGIASSWASSSVRGFRGFMNFNFMLAGSAKSTCLLRPSILVILLEDGWLIGLDRWLLVQTGTPWHRAFCSGAANISKIFCNLPPYGRRLFC
jgi:hypothetical protein